MSALTENGLQIDTTEQILDQLINGTDTLKGFKDIYGEDINLSPDTPDGQMLGILAQAIYDQNVLLQDIYNSFSPDYSFGVQQDNTYAINYVKRKGGSYTVVPIRVVINKQCTLQGLDDNANSADATGYTVADNQGNQFYLLKSATLQAGTYDLDFRAKDIGQVITIPNTITNQITVVLGVSSVNNPLSALTIGEDYESDESFRIRRSKTKGITSQGITYGLESALNQLDGVIASFVYENNTDVEDNYGTKPHTIWVIVQGGVDDEIANKISIYKSNGTPMRGDQEVKVQAPNDVIQVIRFDRPLQQTFYIRFSINSKVQGYQPDQEYIKTQLVKIFQPKMGQSIYSNDFVVLLNSIDENAVFYNLELSQDKETWLGLLQTDSPQYIFNLDINNIIIE